MALSASAADPSVLTEQQRRVGVVNKVAPSVVAIFGAGGGGGGSGVVITPDGYVLTNYHVTDGAGTFMKCGLNDGVLYDGVIVGIDPTGDVAMVKLFGREDFPVATLGDSDQVQVGDWVYAMGNPFLLATDFHPTVTYGIVSGTHRYQYPAGTILEYTDCIQTDSSINPGNSGGPLFNDQGELIGINGRGSFEKRGRVNSGAGYAISINQIKHFMDYLRAGRIVDHATLGATVASDDRGQVLVSNILEESAAYRRGLRYDDELVSFAGRPIGSVNQFKNILGIYPQGWKLPLTYRREGEKHEIFVRLRALHRSSELTGKPEPEEGPKGPQPKIPEPKGPMPPANPHAAQEKIPEHLAKFHVKKPGFANYYFNELEQQRVLAGITRLGDFSQKVGDWRLTGKLNDQAEYKLRINDQICGLLLGPDTFLQEFGVLKELKDEPPGTGGMLIALYQLRLMLTKGPNQFTSCTYLGSEPLDGIGERVDILETELGEAVTQFYFRRSDGEFIGLNTERGEDVDPSEIRINAFGEFANVRIPISFLVRSGELDYGVFSVDSFQAQ